MKLKKINFKTCWSKKIVIKRAIIKFIRKKKWKEDEIISNKTSSNKRNNDQIWRKNKLNYCFKTWRVRHENREGKRKEKKWNEKPVNTKLEIHWLHTPLMMARRPRGFKHCCENLLLSTVRHHTHYLNDKKTIHTLMRKRHASTIFLK
jgi:hypothetical protein